MRCDHGCSNLAEPHSHTRSQRLSIGLPQNKSCGSKPLAMYLLHSTQGLSMRAQVWLASVCLVLAFGVATPIAAHAQTPVVREFPLAPSAAQLPLGYEKNDY